MSAQSFDILLDKIHRRLLKGSLREALSPKFRLFLTLIFLAHGPGVPFLAWSFKIGVSTARSIIHEVCSTLWEELVDDYLPELDADQWKQKAIEFNDLWDMPNCCGAVDGKHINIECPPNSGSLFFNYKGHHSINLMAVSDAKYNFVSVDVGAYGGNSDGGVFANSAFGKRFLDKKVNFPDTEALPGTNLNLPYYIVGDAAFPLKENLMRPYPGQQLPALKENFNKRLSRARRVIENSFGILVARWRILKNTLVMEPTSAVRITNACIVLHNFLNNTAEKEYRPPNFVDIVDCEGEIVRSGDWRQGSNPLASLSHRSSGNNSTQHALDVRNLLSEYLFTHPIGMTRLSAD
ncbi:uncharacterized protein LOC128735480 [Sabethes cyaneus]|uniref:uncharacterized protein LOC128735480 n=1 Tax=Sabethes cyaneus TaxID=53552 RepID=UPI00237DB638|nr:uncharacterized protein LOC128735480 [Sabethes cyaneus]